MELCEAYIPYGYFSEAEAFFDFIFKYSKKVLIVKKTPFAYNKENIDKVIKESSTKKCREYCDMLNSTLYYASYIKNKQYNEEEYKEYLEKNFWQNKETITEDKINKLIEEAKIKRKGPSKNTRPVENRYFIIPDIENRCENMTFFIDKDLPQNRILDYSIYNLDDDLKNFLLDNDYTRELFIDNDYVLQIVFFTDDHALAVSEIVGDTYMLYLNKEEKEYLKNAKLVIQWSNPPQMK